MENVLNLINRIIFPAGEKEEEALLPTVEEELTALKREIDAAQTRFDFADSDGATETAIYDLNALEVRYRMLVREIKNNE